MVKVEKMFEEQKKKGISLAVSVFMNRLQQRLLLSKMAESNEKFFFLLFNCTLLFIICFLPLLIGTKYQETVLNPFKQGMSL